MQAQNEGADFFIATPAVELDQVLNGQGEPVAAGIVRLKLLRQRLSGQLPRFAFVEHGHLRVETQLVEMLAHEAQAKTVERANVGEVKERELARPMVIGGRGGGFFFKFAAEALAQLGGGGLGESDDEQFVQRNAFAVKAVEAAGNERPGLAGAGAGHHQDVTASGNRLPLGRREQIFSGGRRFHAHREFQVSGRNFQVFNAAELALTFRMSESLRLKDQPVNERPRERLVARGPEALTQAELIAILLRTGLHGANVVQVGQNLLQKFGSLNALARATVDELKQIAGVGPDKAATLVAAFALARRMEQERRDESPVLDNPATVVNYMRETNRLLSVESFQALLLNTRKRLIRVEDISLGTLDTILVHPREVFRTAIVANAAAVVLLHNHPSGVIPHPVLCRMAQDLPDFGLGQQLSHAA